MLGYSSNIFFLLFFTCFQTAATGVKKTEFMSVAELAIHGNLSVGDIIESKVIIPFENETQLELPLYHKAIVVDPKALVIVHYRYKHEKDTTKKERQMLESLKKETGTGDMAQNMLDSIFQQMKRNFRNAKNMDDFIRVTKTICSRGPKNGMMDMLYKLVLYKYENAKNRKVYMDNLVENIGAAPCRVNNEQDLKWDPLPGEMIVRRAMSMIGVERFDIAPHNSETFANWARYGKNYTEKGERFGEVIHTTFHEFQNLCHRASSDLIYIFELKCNETTAEFRKNMAKGAARVDIAAVLCVLFPSSCPIAIITATTDDAALDGYLNFYDAKEKVLIDSQSPSIETIYHFSGGFR